jgi:hypothetical protein
MKLAVQAPVGSKLERCTIRYQRMLCQAVPIFFAAPAMNEYSGCWV